MNSNDTKQCKKCKEMINKKAKICPKCGSKQGISKLLIALIVIFAFGVIANLGGNEEESFNDDNATNDITNSTNDVTNSKPQESIQYIKVDKDDLDTALESNAAAAKDKYYNKYVEVTGKLGTIDSDLKYISLMSLRNQWDFNGIHCTIKNQSQRDVVKSLSKDQEITIRGKITDVGEVLGYYLDIIEIIT